MQRIAGRIVGAARRLDAGFQVAQAGRLGLQPGDGLLDVARQLLALVARFVALVEPEQVLPARQLLMQFAVLPGHLGLSLQLDDLVAQLVADVLDPGEVLAGVGEAVLGLAAALLVFGDAGRLLEEEAQLLGLGLDDARDHALLDDGVGARTQAGAHEKVDHVAPAHVHIVDVVGRLAVAVEHALDGDLGILRPLAAGAALGIVEMQLDAGAADGLALAGAVEDDVLHGLAAQGGGLGLAEHPAHGVDHVGFAAAVGADHAHELARRQDGGRVDEGLEPGKFQLG